MNKEKQLRLAELFRKSALTDAEQTERDALIVEAKAANIDYESEAFKNAKPDTATTGEELKGLITAAVAEATKGTGIDQDALVDKIKGLSGDALTADAVKGIVLEAMGGSSFDQAALITAIQAKMPSQGITNDQLVSALEKFAKNTPKTASKNVFDATFGGELPVEHRTGNMSVSQKQLLNLCLMDVSREAKESTIEKGGKIPTDMNDGITSDQLKAAQMTGKRHVDSVRRGKALSTGAAGSGLELVPTDLSSDLQARFYLESALGNSLMASEIDMPSQTYELPLLTTRTNFYTGSEAPSTDPTESTVGTGKIVLQAKKLIGVSDYSYEADEDSIVPILPILTDNLAVGAADAFEGAIINGDLTGTHQDSDIAGVAGHHAKLFTGLRKYALAAGLTSDLSAGGISAQSILAMKKQMKRWGIRPRDLMLIVGSNAYNTLLGIEETLTFEKVGNASAARILTGEAGSIFGIPIIVSDQMREDLNAGGVYDGTTTSKGSFLMAHRPSLIVGSRRGFTVEVDSNIKRQVNSVVASYRKDFKPMETPSASIPTVIAGINYDA